MNDRLRHWLRAVIPFPLRRWLIGVRAIRGPSDVFGRLGAGGFYAAISLRATARRWRHVRIGPASTVERDTHFHSNDDGPGLRVVVGERCFIGQACFFSAGDLIEIAQDCNIGAACHLLAAGHEIGRPTTMSYACAPVISYGRMRLGANTWVGIGCTLVGDVQIGFGSILAAGSLLKQSLPPLCLAAGHPARIVKLYDLSLGVWVRLPDAEPSRAEALARHLASLPTEATYSENLTF
jgi:acetyltransferase-like isoleucine patch superfamily enzyme